MTGQACSTCGNPAARLPGGVCQACLRCAVDKHAQTIHQALDCPAYEARVRCPGGCACPEGHCVLRPLPAGAPETVQQLAGEPLAEGVEVGLLREPEALPGELGSVPRAIEAAIDAFQRSLNGVGGRPGRHRRELRSAIRAELDAAEQRAVERTLVEEAQAWGERQRYLDSIREEATEQRVRERLHVEGMRKGVERMRAAAAPKRYRTNDDVRGQEIWRVHGPGPSAALIEIRRDVPADHWAASRWLWVTEEQLAQGWTEVEAPSSGDVCGVRAAAWHTLPLAERRDALYERDRSRGRSWPHAIPCPGCGAAAGEPCREATAPSMATRERFELEAELDAARADAAQQRRILAMRESDAQAAGDRWREELAHAETNTQDAERQRDAALAQLDALRAELANARHERDRLRALRVMDRAALERAERERDEALSELRAGRDTL